jgi:hypothetical protein
MILLFAVNFLSAFWNFARTCARNSRDWRGWVGFLTIPVSAWLASRAPLAALAILHAPALLGGAFAAIERRREKQIAYQQVRDLVENIIFCMRAGRSFRTSLAESAAELQDGVLARQLKPWISAMGLHQRLPTAPDWWAQTAAELAATDTQAHRALNRMQAWRARLKFESDFRRRSGQVVTQVRLQALILTGLYLALLVFTLYRGEWRANCALIGASVALFTAGVILVFRMGKRIKWTF